MAKGSGIGASLKATGGVGKGFMVSDASMKLKGASVDSSPDRGSKTTPNQKTIGPRNA
jgi:hypothetical protein